MRGGPNGLLALLAAVGRLLIAASDTPEVQLVSGLGVIVDSAATLVGALEQGALHILVTQHLDLRDQQDYVMDARNATLSIRGHCTAEPSVYLIPIGSTGTAPLLPRRPGQCLLVYESKVLAIGNGYSTEVMSEPPQVQRLWIHNLYFRRDGGDGNVLGAIEVGANVMAWLTDVTVQGDGLRTRASTGLVLSDRAAGVHAERAAPPLPPSPP